MRHYPHHIGDFDRATRHLTRIERSVYRDLIDLYYDTEQRLTLDLAALCRRIVARTNEESTAVQQVLNEFFTETPTGWYHDRCEVEIAEYHANTSQRAMAGKASAEAKRRKKLQALNENATSVERTLKSVATDCQQNSTNHKPINQSTNQPISVPNGTGAADAAPTARDLVFANGVPLLTVAGVAEKNARSMLAGLCKRNGDAAVANALAECAKARPVEPVSWLQAVLAGKTPASKQQAIEDRNRAVADAWIPPELRGAEPQEAH